MYGFSAVLVLQPRHMPAIKMQETAPIFAASRCLLFCATQSWTPLLHFLNCRAFGKLSVLRLYNDIEHELRPVFSSVGNFRLFATVILNELFD